MIDLINLDNHEFRKIYPILRKVIHNEDANRLLSFNATSHVDSFTSLSEEEIFNLGKRGDLVSKASEAEIRFYMSDVLLRDSDQMSMNNALEIRVPFLDHNLVEYVLSAPDSYKLTNPSKKLLTDSVSGLIPEEIIQRKKMGFVFPWEVWMRGEMKEFVHHHVVNLSKREDFSYEYIIEYLNDFFEGKKDISWSRVWHLVVLDIWLSENSL